MITINICFQDTTYVGYCQSHNRNPGDSVESLVQMEETWKF